MKKKIIIGICILIFIVLMVVIDSFYDDEEEYQNALERINYYKELCESAEFIFEVEHLKSPEEQAKDGYSTLNYVSPKCYELRGNVKVYHNLKTMEYNHK